MIPDIIQIISESVQAPSGHNYQPWKFKIRHGEDDVLDIYNIPEADKTIYNYLQRGSYLSIGALIENIVIVSTRLGLCTEITINNEGVCLATIKFRKENEVPDDPLYESIMKRATNRLPFKKTPVPESQLKLLQNAAEQFSGSSVYFLQDRKKIDDLANVFSLNEFLLLSNKEMHKSLFPHIVWDTKTFQNTRKGLYVETMGLNPVARFLFKKASNWEWVSKAKKFKFPQFVAKQNAATYRSCSTIGIITIKNLQRSNYILAGRLFERIWLTATKNALNLQPLAAVVYLANRIIDGDAQIFNQGEKQKIISGYKFIRDSFQVNDGEQIAMVFRLGYGTPPKARSLYLDPTFE